MIYLKPLPVQGRAQHDPNRRDGFSSPTSLTGLDDDRLAQARSCSAETINVASGRIEVQLDQPVGVSEDDCAIGAVGFEARIQGHGSNAPEAPTTVLNSLMTITAAGGAIGIPDL